MNNLATLIEELKDPDFSIQTNLGYSNPIKNQQQLKALDRARQLCSNEFDVRPSYIKLMAKLLRAGLHYEDCLLEKHEIERFTFWLEDEMDLLQQLDLIHTNAYFSISEHYKCGGEPLEEKESEDG